jgi:hypothetical protein
LVEAENAVLNTPINSLAEAIAFWDFATLLSALAAQRPIATALLKRAICGPGMDG